MMQLVHTPLFSRTVKVISMNNPRIRNPLQYVLIELRKDPFLPKLQTKRVFTRKFGVKWSSLVWRDIRVVWDFTHDKKKIQLLTIGSNKEPLKVYS